MTFERTDIALLQESYPDITPVAGILSTTFSTPLSHVNLRATAWDIPNAGYKKARTEFGKFVIDLKTDDIYFIDVNLFELHADFVLGVLLKQAWTSQNVRE